jgi:outer membrane protein assembly factor BamD
VLDGRRLVLSVAAALILAACAGNRPAFDIPPGGDDPLTPARAAIASGNETSAINRLTDFLRENPGSAYVDEATYLLGRAHLAEKETDSRVLAADYFQRVLRDYPQSRFACDAAYYLAVAYDNLSLPSQLDQDWTMKAIGAYRQFTTTCSDRAEVESAKKRMQELEDRLAKKAFENGVLYFKMKVYDAAEVYFKKAIDDYPVSPYACRAATSLGEIHLKRQRWTEASDQLQKVVDTCPDRDLQNRARELLARARAGLAENRPSVPDTSGAADSASTPK